MFTILYTSLRSTPGDGFDLALYPRDLYEKYRGPGRGRPARPGPWP